MVCGQHIMRPRRSAHSCWGCICSVVLWLGFIDRGYTDEVISRLSVTGVDFYLYIVKHHLQDVHVPTFIYNRLVINHVHFVLRVIAMLLH